MAKQLPARRGFKVSAIATACANVLFDQLSHAASIETIIKGEREDSAVVYRDALFAMRDAAPNTGAYLSACIEVYGNGRPSLAKDYLPGMLRQRLNDNGIDLNVIKAQLGYLRAVAPYLADPVNNSKRNKPDGSPLELRTLYKAALAAKKPITVPHKEPTNEAGNSVSEVNAAGAKANVTAQESTQQWITRVGLNVVLAECAAILAANKATATDAKAVTAIAEHVTAIRAVAKQ